MFLYAESYVSLIKTIAYDQNRLLCINNIRKIRIVFPYILGMICLAIMLNKKGDLILLTLLIDLST